MHADDIKALFDQQAAHYDSQWAKTSPIRDCLHLLVDSLFAELPEDARILSVGAGTGAELAFLAARHPQWRFTVVEPSGGMVAVCRERAAADGFLARCSFHEGYLDTLEAGEAHHAATCFLVSQFLLERDARVAFFAGIAARLLPGGILASTDLAADIDSDDYEVLLRAWLAMMATAEVTPDAVARMRQAYANDVGVLPTGDIAGMIEAAGFAPPLRFFQAGLIHGWRSQRAS